MMKKYKSKDKLPPGTVRKEAATAASAAPFEVLIYDEKKLTSEKVKIEELKNLKIPSGETVWIHYPSVSGSEALQAVGDRFNIHPLVLEDIQNDDHRPKMEDYPAFNFIIQKDAVSENDDAFPVFRHLAYIHLDTVVITFAAGNPFGAITQRLSEGKGIIRQKKADYLLLCLMDVVSDGYFQIVESLEEQIEFYETRINLGKANDDAAAVLTLKKKAVLLRQVIRPFKNAIDMQKKSVSPPIDKNNMIYYRDLNDHLIQLLDNLETMIITADSLVSLILNMASNQMNGVMKVLTIIATIFIPLTFIAGIYGMNFRYMPELTKPWAYPVVLGGMILTGVIMVIIFKRKKWF